jgi:hypothetical protein
MSNLKIINLELRYLYLFKTSFCMMTIVNETNDQHSLIHDCLLTDTVHLSIPVINI